MSGNRFSFGMLVLVGVWIGAPASIGQPNHGKSDAQTAAAPDNATPGKPSVDAEHYFKGHGRRTAVVIGVSDYGWPSANLDYGYADAVLVAGTLVKHGAFEVHLFTEPPAETETGKVARRGLEVAKLAPEAPNTTKGEERVLADNSREPTAANIREMLEKICQSNSETILVYFSGHAVVNDGICYLIPKSGLKEAKVELKNVIALKELYDILLKSNARNIVIVLDACHSGTAADAPLMAGSTAPKDINFRIDEEHKRGAALLGEEQKKETTRELRQVMTLASSSGSEYSHESHVLKQGVFTYWLVDGMKGSADGDDNHVVTVEELKDYLSKVVPNDDALKHFAEQQHPMLRSMSTGVFPLTYAKRVKDKAAPIPSEEEEDGKPIVPDPAAEGAMIVIAEVLEHGGTAEIGGDATQQRVAEIVKAEVIEVHSVSVGAPQLSQLVQGKTIGCVRLAAKAKAVALICGVLRCKELRKIAPNGVGAVSEWEVRLSLDLRSVFAPEESLGLKSISAQIVRAPAGKAMEMARAKIKEQAEAKVREMIDENRPQFRRRQ